jgi:hypothetical protein
MNTEYSSAQLFVSRKLAKDLEQVDRQSLSIPQTARLRF